MGDRKFAKEQPKQGDVVLHCGHLDGTRHHFLKYREPVTFRRPDGTTGTATWVVQCQQCFGHGEGPAIRGDGIWRGNEPTVVEHEKN